MMLMRCLFAMLVAALLAAPTAYAVCKGDAREWPLLHDKGLAAADVSALLAELNKLEGFVACARPLDEDVDALGTLSEAGAALAVLPLDALAPVSASFARLQAPFAFDGYRSLFAFLRGPGLRLLEARLQETGLVYLGVVGSHFMQMSSASPLSHPSDAAGQRLGWRAGEDLSSWLPLLTATGRELRETSTNVQPPTIVSGDWAVFSDANNRLSYGVVETNHRLNALILVATSAALERLEDAQRVDALKAIRASALKLHQADAGKNLALREKLVADGAAVWLMTRKNRLAWRDRLSPLLGDSLDPALEAAIKRANRPH